MILVHPALYKSAHSLGLFNKRLFFCVFSDFNEDELETLARSAGDSDYEKGDSGDDDDDDDDDDGMKSSSDEKESGAKHSAVTDEGQTNTVDDSDSDDDDSDDVVENISLSDSDTDETE